MKISPSHRSCVRLPIWGLQVQWRSAHHIDPVSASQSGVYGYTVGFSALLMLCPPKIDWQIVCSSNIAVILFLSSNRVFNRYYSSPSYLSYLRRPICPRRFLSMHYIIRWSNFWTVWGQILLFTHRFAFYLSIPSHMSVICYSTLSPKLRYVRPIGSFCFFRCRVDFENSPTQNAWIKIKEIHVIIIILCAFFVFFIHGAIYSSMFWNVLIWQPFKLSDY